MQDDTLLGGLRRSFASLLDAPQTWTFVSSGIP